ncbi:hypothetical protein [Thaumasiovibrio sp. DFM-14]|uniref:hypothetical protein n=1 Tax=Thaumasiovibrio sp. DFM-14 TaxID=3384792 RepID=UPI0039A1E810
MWVSILEQDDFQGQQRCMGCFSQPMLEALAFAVEQMEEFGIKVVRESLLAFCHGELEPKECNKGHPRISNVRDFLDVVEKIYRNRQYRKQIAAKAAAQIEKKRNRLFWIQNVWQMLVCVLIPLFLPLFALCIALRQFPQQFVLGAVFMIMCCCVQVALVWQLLQTDWITKLESPLIQERTGMPGVAIGLSYLYGAVCYVLALIPYSILYSLLWIPDSPPKYLQWLVKLM